MFHQLLRKIAQGFDWLKYFLSEWNNNVYFRTRRSRPSMGSAALGVLSGRKYFRRSKTKRERRAALRSGEMFGLTIL